MDYTPRTKTASNSPRTKMPSDAAKARAVANLKKKRAAKEITRTNRSMNALDEAITKGKTLPIKGRKKLPPDYDVIVPGMKKPPKKIKKK